MFLRSLVPSPPPWFSAAVVGGEHWEAPVAAAAASPRRSGRAARQVLSNPRAFVATSLLCPAARLPQCIWGVGGKWAPGPGGGGGCGAGQKQPLIPAAREPRAPGAPASPGLSYGDLCKRQHRSRLLQLHRQNHDDRGFPIPGECPRVPRAAARRELQARLSRSGRVPGPSLRRARGRAGWVRGLAREGNTLEGSNRSFGGAAGLSWDLGMKANCFACSRAALEEALEVAVRLPAHFRAFSSPRPPRAPTLAPSPGTGRCPLRVVWGWGCDVRRPGMAAAAALLQLQCHVGMLPQWERVVPVRAGPWRPLGAPAPSIT